MDIIQLLPDSVANQIAAGEVIQRPDSVIKELVENAIDAGASHIQVLVCDAGKTSIQVIDDGKGMSETDARLAFERHATSKIRKAQDLFSLHTMGFRGEALAAIAAVAQVTLQTRTADDELGTRIVIAGSKVVSQEPVACPVGANFLIENLFFNIPARRKFLKSNATEMAHITHAFERIVLVYPDINFTMFNNGTEVLQLRASNTRQRIIDLFGKRLNQQLLPVETETSICNITGFVGKPEYAKKKGAHQYFFVNGRFMKHGYFHKAVMSAFERLVPDGEQVSYFLYLKVNPEDIDVNIHPVKTEIKFNNEQAIWQILMAAVRDAVGRFMNLDSLDFDTEGKPDIPVFNPEGNPFISAPKIDFNPQYNPFAGTKKPSAKGWEELFGGENSDIAQHRDDAKDIQTTIFERDMPQMSALFGNETPRQETIFDNAMPQQESVSQDGIVMSSALTEKDFDTEHYQFHGSYIVTQTATGLMMIDQHRASQRILYERFMQSLKSRTANTQKVLFPEVVQFPPSYSEMLEEILEELRALGFEITDLGGYSYAIAGIPAGLGGLDAVSLVNELVSQAMEYGGGITEQVHTILAQTLANKAATPYGEYLSNDDMHSLIRQLFACQTQRYTSDGKPIAITIDSDEIERRFK